MAVEERLAPLVATQSTQGNPVSHGLSERFRKSFTRYKDTAATIQSVISSLAILFAGDWVLFLFDPLSALRPNLSLTQQVSSTRLGGGVILLNMDVLLTNTSKASARLSCVWVEVQRLLPVDSTQREDINQKLWHIHETASTAFPEIKSVTAHPTLVVPAGGSVHFPADCFIPDVVSPDKPELLEMLLIKSWFFSGRTCDLKEPNSSVVTIHDITQSASTSPSAAR